ncbi:MAG: sodium-dependent transporter [Candidatus Methylomirabilales bacterium]
MEAIPGERKRETWGSRMAFVLAAAGSAVGLGNIWRFPYLTGQNGGAAFVFIYLAIVFLIGIPVMMAEVGLGRLSRRNPVGAFDRVAPKSAWRSVGVLGVISGFAILSYYSVLAGWTIGYTVKTVTGAFATLTDPGQTGKFFGQFVGNAWSVLALHALFMALTVIVVIGGVRRGIERWTFILMPILFFMLMLLVLRSLTLAGAAKGIAFYLKPDFSKVTTDTFLAALGQAFFSLSLGMGAMITYGSYLSEREDVVVATVSVSLFDTLAAFLAGLAIFPAVFAVEGVEPTTGAGLAFVVLPAIFHRIPLGSLFGTIFFSLLAVAALTSAISLLEVCVAYLTDEKGWTRKKACTLAGVVSFLLGIPAALSTGASGFLSHLPIFQMGFLDLMDTTFGNFSLTVGALLFCLFVGWRWAPEDALAAVMEGSAYPSLGRPWLFLIRYLCPLAIGIILLQFLTKFLVQG